jgi:hypothetical protein
MRATGGRLSFTIDESKFPVVALTHSQSVSDDDLAQVLAAIDRWLAKGEPFALLIDSRGGLPFSAEQRASIVEHMKANRAATEQLLVQALVIDNPLLRAFYYAVSWAAPMPFPSKVFSEVATAREWIDLQLSAKARHKKESAAS